MKRNQPNRRWAFSHSTLISLAAIILFGCSQAAQAQQQIVTRMLPLTVNNEVDIGSFVFTNGAGSLWISVTVPSSGYSVAKEYLVPIQFGQGGNTWQIVMPVSNTGPYSNNDFALDVKVNGNTASLRLRTTASDGSSVGTAYVFIKQEGATDPFNASSATSAVTAPTTYFNTTALTQLNGNVGVGIATPAQMFHVHGSGNYSGTRVTTAASGATINDGVNFGYDDSYGAYIWNRETNSIVFATSNTERARFDANGNFGIGTTNPTGMFSVATSGTGANTMGLFDSANDTPTTFPNFAFQRSRGTLTSRTAVLSGDRLGGFAFRGYGTTGFLTSSDNAVIRAFAAENFTDTAMGTYITFETTPTGTISRSEKLRISANGNIGVGTTTPGFKLDVQGGLLNAAGGLCIAGDCKTAWSQVGGGGSSQWTTSGSNIYFNTGSVGLGTASPNNKLEVVEANSASASSIRVLSGSSSAYAGYAVGRTGTEGYWGIAGAPNHYANGAVAGDVVFRAENNLILSNFGFPSVYLKANGNVGIGTVAPAAQLHVAGANGATNNTAANAPDALQVIGGTGGNGTWGGSAGGVGGTLNLTGGTGGTPVAGSQAAFGGKGGSINLAGGTGGPNVFAVGGGAGGDVQLNGGAGVSNTNGNVLLANLRGNVGVGTSSPGYRLDVQGGQLNSSGGLCIAGDCKTAWSQVGGSSQWTTSGSAIYYNSGNVGIGSSSPGSKLDVSGTVRSGNADTNAGNHPSYGTGYSAFWRQGADYSLLTDGTNSFLNAPNSAGNVYFRTANGDKMFLQGSTGNFGIGTTSPSSKLHVAGDGRITGNLTVDGNIAAKYQDLAEWVESSQALPAGTVVVLDSSKSNQVIASSQAYDTRVAGVISASPGIALGENGEGKVLVATTGRVRVKVDASAGPIHVGDLLVTSDIEGVAKKSEPLNLGGVQIHRPGTLIGKALEPLAKGSGEILVLLSLQ
jgi:hypothetical protein